MGNMGQQLGRQLGVLLEYHRGELGVLRETLHQQVSVAHAQNAEVLKHNQALQQQVADLQRRLAVAQQKQPAPAPAPAPAPPLITEEELTALRAQLTELRAQLDVANARVDTLSTAHHAAQQQAIADAIAQTKEAHEVESRTTAIAHKFGRLALKLGAKRVRHDFTTALCVQRGDRMLHTTAVIEDLDNLTSARDRLMELMGQRDATQKTAMADLGAKHRAALTKLKEQHERKADKLRNDMGTAALELRNVMERNAAMEQVAAELQRALDNNAEVKKLREEKEALDAQAETKQALLDQYVKRLKAMQESCGKQVDEAEEKALAQRRVNAQVMTALHKMQNEYNSTAAQQANFFLVLFKMLYMLQPEGSEPQQSLGDTVTVLVVTMDNLMNLLAAHVPCVRARKLELQDGVAVDFTALHKEVHKAALRLEMVMMTHWSYMEEETGTTSHAAAVQTASERIVDRLAQLEKDFGEMDRQAIIAKLQLEHDKQEHTTNVACAANIRILQQVTYFKSVRERGEDRGVRLPFTEAYIKAQTAHTTVGPEDAGEPTRTEMLEEQVRQQKLVTACKRAARKKAKKQAAAAAAAGKKKKKQKGGKKSHRASLRQQLQEAEVEAKSVAHVFSRKSAQEVVDNAKMLAVQAVPLDRATRVVLFTPDMHKANARFQSTVAKAARDKLETDGADLMFGEEMIPEAMKALKGRLPRDRSTRSGGSGDGVGGAAASAGAKAAMAAVSEAVGKADKDLQEVVALLEAWCLRARTTSE